MNFLMNICPQRLQKVYINKLTDDEDQNMLDTLKVTGIVYDALVKAVDELKDEMDKMLASV